MPTVIDQSQLGLGKVELHANHNPNKQMLGAEWTGKHSITVNRRDVPVVTDPRDAILRVTSTAICGSDLHMYEGAMPGMRKGDLLGHEFMGIVEDVGPEVKNFKKGDRVVAAFDLGCGACMYCKKGLYSCCDVTNTSDTQEMLYGHRTCGMHGYSALTGGYEGGQAEYARVIFADTNLLRIPDSEPDEKWLFLSDILPTAWWANELANVQEGSVVAIWGSGPVGILAAQCAFARGANRVIIIDEHAYRLQRAQEAAPGVETIKFAERKTLDALHEMVPNGPDCSIEAVGFHYAHSLTHKVEMKVMMETDPSEIINEIIYATRKGGYIGVIGVYAGYCNHFNIGAFMEKGLHMGAGQTPVQSFWQKLLGMIKEGKLRPQAVISHILPLKEADKGYDVFNAKRDNDKCIKVVLKPDATQGRFLPSARDALTTFS